MRLLASALQAASLVQSRPAWRRYGVALAGNVAALLFTVFVVPKVDREVFFAPFLGVVMISAWYGGLVPGLVATSFGIVATEFLLPTGLRPPGIVRLAVFVGVAVLISSLTGARRRAEEALKRSQERYALAQRAANVGTWDWNILTGDMTWSDEMEGLFGLAHGELPRTYADFLERVHPDDRSLVTGAVTACIDQRKDFAAEYRIVWPDGSVRWVAGTGDVYRDASSKAVRMLGVLQDVTARRRMEEERSRLLGAEQSARSQAEASERRVALLTEVGQRLMSSLDYRVTLARVVQMLVPAQADGCAIYLEEGSQVQRVAFKHIVPEKQALFRALDERYPLDLESESPPAVAIRTGTPQIGQEVALSVWEASARDSEHLRLLVGLSPQSYMAVPLASRGRVFGALFLVMTESDRLYGEDDLAFAQHLARRASIAIENARLYREADQARKEAEAANRSKDEFLATVSHEIRTPLNAILGWAVLLGKRKLNEATSIRAVESIERNARAQRQLIDDLLDLSRITSGRLRLEVREVDLEPVVEAALDAVRPLAEAKGITVDMTIDAATGPASGDPDRLQQVVWNLLSNAVKFTDRGGHVRVQLRPRVDRVEISVVDSGQGIAGDLLPYVFDRFRQGDTSPSRRHGGLGLGLAIVRHLVELHGGTVAAASHGLGKGSTFTVALPVPDASAPAMAEPPPALAGSETAIGDGPRLDGTRVLVVDDEAEARLLVVTLLESAGAEVVSADSAAAAREVLERWTPDVLVSDIGMPGEDGFSFIQGIRQREAGRGGALPAVAVTAYARPEDRERVLAAGFQVHLSKPIEPAGLLAVLRALAPGRRSAI